eukprot:235242_1
MMAYFKQIKLVDQATKDIVFGFIHECERLLFAAEKAYIMPPLVHHTCLSYFWIEPVLIQGFLLKKSAGLSTASKKRWFVLDRNNNLAWYHQPENAKTQKNKPLDEISLYDVTNLNKKIKIDDKGRPKYKFELVTPKRKIALKAEDVNTYHSWIRRISARVTPTVIYQSWALKKGHKNRHWGKRYFSLVNYEEIYELRYYETDKKKKFKGVIVLTAITQVTVVQTEQATKKYGKSNKWVLELTTSNRVYVLSYKTLDLMTRWEDELIRAKFDDDSQLTLALARSVSSTGDDGKKTETLQQGLGDILHLNPLQFGAGNSSVSCSGSDEPHYKAQASATSTVTLTSVDEGYDEEQGDNQDDNDITDDGFYTNLDITGFLL